MGKSESSLKKPTDRTNDGPYHPAELRLVILGLGGPMGAALLSGGLYAMFHSPLLSLSVLLAVTASLSALASP